jgi:hypothetical protein
MMPVRRRKGSETTMKLPLRLLVLVLDEALRTGWTPP